MKITWTHILILIIVIIVFWYIIKGIPTKGMQTIWREKIGVEAPGECDLEITCRQIDTTSLCTTVTSCRG